MSVREAAERLAKSDEFSSAKKGCPWEHPQYERLRPDHGPSPMMKWQADCWDASREYLRLVDPTPLTNQWLNEIFKPWRLGHRRGWEFLPSVILRTCDNDYALVFDSSGEGPCSRLLVTRGDVISAYEAIVGPLPHDAAGAP